MKPICASTYQPAYAPGSNAYYGGQAFQNACNHAGYQPQPYQPQPLPYNPPAPYQGRYPAPTTLNQQTGFMLGDAGNYAVIAFNPTHGNSPTNAAITGDVGIGPSAAVVDFSSDSITGNLTFSGPTNIANPGAVSGATSGNSGLLASDIEHLKKLSTSVANEYGTPVNLGNENVNADQGAPDNSGNAVFTATGVGSNIFIQGDGEHNVVINIPAGFSPTLGNVTLSGGIKIDQVLFNYLGNQTVTSVAGATFQGTFLAPCATIDVSGLNVQGRIFGAVVASRTDVPGTTISDPTPTGGAGSPSIGMIYQNIAYTQSVNSTFGVQYSNNGLLQPTVYSNNGSIYGKGFSNVPLYPYGNGFPVFGNPGVVGNGLGGPSGNTLGGAPSNGLGGLPGTGLGGVAGYSGPNAIAPQPYAPVYYGQPPIYGAQAPVYAPPQPVYGVPPMVHYSSIHSAAPKHGEASLHSAHGAQHED